MRALIIAFVGGPALSASSQAAPLAPKPTTLEPGVMPPVELASGGCGWGWPRRHWQDRWGNWRWAHCVPDNGLYVSWGAGRYYPYTYWHGGYPAWGRGYQ